MNVKHTILGALAVAALAIGIASPASAGSIMCSPANSPVSNARTVGGTTSQVPSGTLYVLNSEGCAAVSNQDVGYFRSQGYYPGPNLFSISAVGIAAQSTTANSPILPAGAFIVGIVIQETAGQAVTGGLDIGTAGSSSQTIVAAYTCAASCLVGVPPANILLFTFGATTSISGKPAQQQVFINAHTNWTDGAIVNVTIFYSLYIPT